MDQCATSAMVIGACGCSGWRFLVFLVLLVLRREVQKFRADELEGGAPMESKMEQDSKAEAQAAPVVEELHGLEREVAGSHVEEVEESGEHQHARDEADEEDGEHREIDAPGDDVEVLANPGAYVQHLR